MFCSTHTRDFPAYTLAATQHTAVHSNLHLAPSNALLVLDGVGHLVQERPRQEFVRHVGGEITGDDPETLGIVDDLETAGQKAAAKISTDAQLPWSSPYPHWRHPATYK